VKALIFVGTRGLKLKTILHLLLVWGFFDHLFCSSSKGGEEKEGVTISALDLILRTNEDIALDASKLRTLDALLRSSKEYPVSSR
jgi:hypothetical protein